MFAPSFSRSDAVANRARLIEAARAVFAERGPLAEMKEIAERAGVGVGTVYRNFATKDELLAAIIEETINSAILTIESSVTQFEVEEILPNLVSHMLFQAEENAALCYAVMTGADGEPGPPPNFAALLTALEKPIRRAQEAGVCRDDIDAVFLAVHLASQFQNYLRLRELLPPDVVRLNLTKLVLAGMAPEGASRPQIHT